MRSSKLRIVWLPWLASNALATDPEIPNGLISTPLHPSTVNATAFKFDVSPPGGPPDFTIQRSRALSPFRRDDCFLFVTNLMASNAMQDFNGFFANPQMIFRDPNYPQFQIVARGYGQTGRLQRRFFLWGMARIMSWMVKNNHFAACRFLLWWRGMQVGWIEWLSIEEQSEHNAPIKNDSSKATGFMQLPPRLGQNKTLVSVNDDELTWEYRFHGAQLTMNNVFMGTIGSLIQAAELENHNLDTFVGYWPPPDYWPSVGYNVDHLWVSQRKPSTFGKDVLVKSILAAARYMHFEENYRELAVEVKYEQQLIARGAINLLIMAGPEARNVSIS